MKKSRSDSGSSGSSSSSSSRRRQRTQPQQFSTVSDDSGDREVITIIQEDDQELAEAKIRARQAQSQPQERVAPPSAPLQSSETARDVGTILKEDDQELAEAKARAAPARAPPPSLQEEAQHPSKSMTEGSSHSHTQPPPQTHQINFLRERDAKEKDKARPVANRNQAVAVNMAFGDSQQDSGMIEEGEGRDAKEKDKARPVAQYVNRNQAVAVNMAFRDSQQDSGIMDLMIVDEEEKVEESGADQLFSDVEEQILLHNYSEHNNVFSSTRGGGAAPLITTDEPPVTRETSQPGAFRVEPSFRPETESVSEVDSISLGEEEGSTNEVGAIYDNSMDRSVKDEDEEDSDTPEDEPQLTADGDILVEATLVSPESVSLERGQTERVIVPEPELVTAERMSDTYPPPLPDKKRRFVWIVGGAVLVFVLIIVSIVIGVVAGKRKDKDKNKEPAVTAAPTMAPTSFYFDVIPKATQKSVETPGTPQEQAYHWYLEDHTYIHNTTTADGSVPEQFQSYVPIERFALATLYYAARGDSWSVSTNWLEHDKSACAWYSTFFGSICSPGAQTRRRSLRGRALQTTTTTTQQYYNRLSLNQNNVTGSLPPEVVLLSNLDVLNMHQNAIGGTIPTEFGTFQHITLFQLFQNKLSGTIPTQLGLLPKVRQLNLAFNELTGTIPTELGQLNASLQTLSASNNPVHGVLPTELGTLSLLEGMFFYNNPNLTGPIPSQFGLLKSMTKLQLYGANWNSTLPSEIGLLSRLREVYLQDNWNLQGTIPESWGNLTQLVQLQLHNTALTGTIPQGLCNLVDQGTLKGLSVNCDNVNCTCACNCYTTSGPNGTELFTESPIIDQTTLNDTEGGEWLTDPPVGWDDPDSGGELTTFPPVVFLPPPCDITSNGTNVSVTDECSDDTYDDDSYGGTEAPQNGEGAESDLPPPPPEALNIETQSGPLPLDFFDELPPEFFDENELPERNRTSNIFSHG